MLKRLPNPATAICSGRMQIRGNRRWQAVDAGFAVSDHADWNGLIDAVKASEAEQVYVTHGSQAVFSKYLNEIGIKVGIINPGKVKTEFSEVRFKGDSDKAKKVYEGLKVLSPQDIADAIFYMASTPYHVNISELEILPNSEANTYVINRNL